MTTKSIGAFIAALRKASGLTQKQLAEKLSVSDKAISRWERDEALPDLSLIPVIAEIFGVTSDEIIRGERITAEGTSPERESAKTGKQLRRILKDTLTKYRIRSIISGALAALGLIAAIIANLAFLRAYVGFMLGCVFFVAAAACQVGFLIQSFAALDSEDLEADRTVPCKRSIISLAMWVFSLIAVLLAACLPLITEADDAYYGLTGAYWLSQGLVYSLIAAIVCLIICTSIYLKLGYWHLPDLKKPLNRLRIRCALIALILLVITGIGHILFCGWLDTQPHLYAPCTSFKSWEEFKSYMETPCEAYRYDSSSGGYAVQQIAPDPESSTIPQAQDEIVEQVLDTEGNELCRYVHQNWDVVFYYFSETPNRLPVYTFTSAQYAEAYRLSALLYLTWLPLYFIELGLMAFYYRNKKKTLYV